MSSTLRPPPRTDELAATTPTAVSIAGVSKSFRLPHQRYHTLKERALHPFRVKSYQQLRAVDDVSVDVSSGEFFGVVGRNGSGKSTLLKCIAGIYDIDQGELRVSGRLSPFIELGVGFNMDLTARDNVMINAIMLGLTHKQARERFEEIITFAELEDFLDLRLKNYSSGMTVRLAFSIAIQVEAEVLLIDEVLAVGDASFQRKCFDEFEELKRKGRTILFVTHDMGTIERFCDRAMLLEKGRVVAVGEPAEIARRYNEINFGSTVHQLGGDGHSERQPGGHRAAEIVDGWFEDSIGGRIAMLAHGDACALCMEVRFNEDLTDPIFGFTLRNEVGHTVFATTTADDHRETGRFSRGHAVIVRLRFENWLTASRYAFTPSVARGGTGADALDIREDLASLLIHGGPFSGGITNLPHSFEIGAG